MVLTIGTCLIVNAKLPLDYKNKLAIEKQNIIFSQVVKRVYKNRKIRRMKNPGLLSTSKLFSTTYLAKSFTNPNDEFEEPKVKLIHTFGAVAKVKFNIIKRTKYTGLFETGSRGIIRLSLAKLGFPYTPGIALKFLIDGKKSQNIFAMFGLDGQGENYNFFKNRFESKIGESKSTILRQLAKRFKLTLIKLGSTHKDPTLQSTRQLSEIRSNGNSVEKPRAPFSLVFAPTKTAQMSKNPGNLLIRLKNKKYSKGLVLYHVFAREKQGAPLELIGNIELDSRLVAGPYGDYKLYFQHNID
jgi:hypothetical protein